MRSVHIAALALLSLAACSTPSALEPTGSHDGPTAPPDEPLGPTHPGANVTPSVPVAPSGPSAAAVAGSNAFGLDLYKRLAAEPGNLAMSPASIAIALSMTYAGARGQTAAEMKHTLHAPDDAAALHGGFASVLASWQAIAGDDAPEIRTVNRLFGEKTLPFDAGFLALGRDRYGAPLDPSDFVHAADAERLRINGWVAEQTRDRIRDLLPDGAITDVTRLVLANALYFKAKWQSPFEKAATRSGTFRLAGGGTKDVPFMNGEHHARYAEVDGVALAELGYTGGRFATLFVVPQGEDGLAALEARLDAATLDRWVGAMTPAALSVALPRFRVEPGAAVLLRPHLEALGMPTAFQEGRADFSGIAPVPLFIDDVYHKAFVAVDEAGTEAAAATAVVMNTESAAAPPDKSFRADRPFLFLVRDTQTGLVLFVGRVAEPAA